MPTAPELTRAELLTLAADVVATGILRREDQSPYYLHAVGSQPGYSLLYAERGEWSVQAAPHMRLLNLSRNGKPIFGWGCDFSRGGKPARDIFDALLERHANLSKPAVMERA